MRIRLIVNLSFFLLLFLAACIPSSTPTQVMEGGNGYALDTRTGIEEIDQVLVALEGGDLTALIRYTSAPCTNIEGLGGPPKCREGEAVGTVSDVLPFMSSEGYYIRKDEIDQWPGVDADRLYAIYRVSDNAREEDYFPQGTYAIIIRRSNGSAVSLRIMEGGIVRIDDIFELTQASLDALIKRDAAEVILAPNIR
jgi:hypothetical protein